MKNILLVASFLVLSGTAKAQLVEQKPIPKALHIAGITMVAVDTITTIKAKDFYGQNFRETNPFYRPIVKLPNPAYATVAMVSAVALDLAADKLNHKHPKMARTLLCIQITGASWGVAQTLQSDGRAIWGPGYKY
jgi:hypothetical protein